MKWWTLQLILLLISCCSVQSVGQKKIALVVGNSAYQNASVLKNPVKDAAAIAEFLNSIGFKVTLKNDLNYLKFREAVKNFSDSIQDKDIVFFFYAGHGIQVDQKNCLIPVDAVLDNKADVQFEVISVETMMSILEINNPNGLNIMVLDACRNNPFKSWERGGQEGLAPISPPSGTIVGFSTSPGSVASDGDGDNGLYTSVLLEQLKINQRIEDTFIQTRNEVERLSGGRQSPWELSRLRGKYYLNPGSTDVTNVTPARVVPTGALGSGLVLSGVIKTKNGKDKKNVEISVSQKGKLLDRMYSDEQGKFAIPVHAQINPFDSVELSFSKNGLEEKVVKVIPNSRGILDVQMRKKIVEVGRSLFHFRFGMKEEGNYYSNIFTLQYLYHTPIFNNRLAFGVSLLSLSNTSEDSYETLPGQFDTNVSKESSRGILAPVRVYVLPFNAKGNFNAYIEVQVPLVSNFDKFIQGSVGVSVKIHPLMRAVLEANYVNYAYTRESVEFNPYGNATVSEVEEKRSGFFPSVSLQYFLKRRK